MSTATATVVPIETDVSVGTQCQSCYNGKWYKAQVVEVLDGGEKIKVSFKKFKYQPIVLTSDCRFASTHGHGISTIASNNGTKTTNGPGPHPLTGEWSHRLCGCCDNCCPSGLGFLTLCPCIQGIVMVTVIPCLVGHIAARASYRPNFVGKHGPPKSSRNNCCQAWLMIFLIILIPTIYYLIEPAWATPLAFIGLQGGTPFFSIMGAVFSTLFYIAFLVIYLWFVSNMRDFIRHKYNIPQTSGCCCDCCVMCCCLPCALAQMYKHVYAENKNCNLFQDPGPHAEDTGGMVTSKTVTTVTVSHPAAVVVAHPESVHVVAHPETVHVVAEYVEEQKPVAVAEPQPAAVAAAQPQPTATAL